MEKSFSESYKAAGVDITAGYQAVELMKEHVRRTMIPGVLGDWAASAASSSWTSTTCPTLCWFRAPTAWAPS